MSLPVGQEKLGLVHQSCITTLARGLAQKLSAGTPAGPLSDRPGSSRQGGHGDDKQEFQQLLQGTCQWTTESPMSIPAGFLQRPPGVWLLEVIPSSTAKGAPTACSPGPVPLEVGLRRTTAVGIMQSHGVEVTYPTCHCTCTMLSTIAGLWQDTTSSGLTPFLPVSARCSSCF